MGTQKAIAEKNRRERADYVLALKGNQTGLYEDVKVYFSDAQIWQEICEKKNHACTVEKSYGQLETREYYQTEDMRWLPRILDSAEG